MARFLVVLRPQEPMRPADLIAALDPLVARLAGEVEHRTSAHLSAMLPESSDHLRLQLFADVQAHPPGPLLELMLISREPMGRGAPFTRSGLSLMLRLIRETLPSLQVVFRSDQDGALPDGG
jgi:hypothetical protein